MSDASFDIGETALDRDDPDTDPAIVVNTPTVPANEWTIPRIDKTAAEDNPEYPADAAVVVVVYEDVLEESLPNWERDDPIPLSDLNEAGVSHYSFPAPRLKQAHDEHSSPDESGDETPDTASQTAEDDGNADKNETEVSDEDENNDLEPVVAETATKGDAGAGSDTLPEPSAELLALQERLEDGGMTVEFNEENQTLRAEKLGQSYRLRPGKVIAGEGMLRDRLEDIVTNDAFSET